MDLRITYFSNNEVHKATYTEVNHWYYNEGMLVIVSKGEEHTMTGVVLLNTETWLPKN